MGRQDYPGRDRSVNKNSTSASKDPVLETPFARTHTQSRESNWCGVSQGSADQMNHIKFSAFSLASDGKLSMWRVYFVMISVMVFQIMSKSLRGLQEVH